MPSAKGNSRLLTRFEGGKFIAANLDCQRGDDDAEDPYRAAHDHKWGIHCVVGSILGRSHEKTTKRYAHLSNEVLLNAVNTAAETMGTDWTRKTA